MAFNTSLSAHEGMFTSGARQAPFEMRGAGMRRVGTKAGSRVGRKANGPAPPLQKVGPSKASSDYYMAKEAGKLHPC